MLLMLAVLLQVMGTFPGVTLEEAKEPAIALGIALQITNILRDVGEDARDRVRGISLHTIYIHTLMRARTHTPTHAHI